MASFISKIETHTEIDEHGNESTTKVEKNTSISRNDEPDYIKIYTHMWAEFNGVPTAYREFFLQLAIRMTYCNSGDLKNAQLVNTGKPYSNSIKEVLGWKDDMYKRGLRELTQSGAIKRVARGVYQINPQYAGKGEWKYNPKLNRGGIEELVTTFNFKNKTVDTCIIWADDGQNTDFNKSYRQGLNVKADNETVLKQLQIQPNSDNQNDKLESK